MRFKLSLLFFSLSLVALLIGGVVVRFWIIEFQDQALTDTMRRGAQLGALTVDAAIASRQRELASVAAGLTDTKAVTAQDGRSLQNTLAGLKRSGFAWAAVVDQNGQVLASSLTAPASSPVPSQTTWLLRGQQGAFVSDQFQADWPAEPVPGAGAAAWGVLLATPVSGVASGPSDSETQPKPAVLVAMLAAPWRESLQKALQPLANAAALGSAPTVAVWTPRGTPVFGGGSPPNIALTTGQCGVVNARLRCLATGPARLDFPGLGWQVVLEIPESLAASAVADFDRRLGTLGGALALLLAVGAWWLADRVSRPVLAAKRLATRMATGDRDPNLPSATKVTGPLGAALGQLLTGLRQQEAEWVRTQMDLETRVADRARELERAVVELQEANTDLDRFTSMVSHDLLAPVRAMRTFSELLLMDYADQLPEEARRLLNRVDQAGQDMSSLVNALHALAKLGNKPLQVADTDMRGVVMQAIRAHTPEWNAETIDVGPLPHCTCDPAMVRVVFDNLIGNAVKYSHRQPVPHITVSGQDEAERCVYWVSDNGAGFDPAYAHRLFQIFQRLHSQREYPGTGVGLATVARIVHRHGGKVWAEGTPNEGATFYFSLPKRAVGAKTELSVPTDA